MPSTWIYIIVNLVICAIASVENEQTKYFIQLTEFEYEDSCASTAEAEWAFINSPSNKTLSVWEEKLISYAAFKNVQKNEVANISKDDINDPSLKYKYDVAEKAGDALLENEDYKTLIHFAGTAELLRLSTVHTEILDNYTRKDVEYLLSHSNTAENKSNIWTAWHQELNPLVKNFTTILPLVDLAAKANDAKDVTAYWELLSNYNDGYDTIQYEWSKIANLHKKILKFAINNLSQKYKIPVEDTAPAYLFGSLQGNDWTHISVEITPYPNLMYNIKKNLWKRKLLGKSLYKTAASMSTQLLNQVPQAEFWDKSKFNQQCPSKLINFCKEGSLRVSTCFEPTISNVLSAYKNVGKIIFNQMSIETIPVLNTANRYSALEEGLSELFGILAASPAWLNYTNVMNNSTDNERLIVSLMITALNVLPSLAYYMAADMWRINAINTGIKDPEELISSWWKHREEYEGLNSNGTNVPTFLDDNYITSNKPYLSKFTGTLLAFQFYEFLMESTEIRYDSIIRKQVDANFIKMLLHGGADDWVKVVDKYLEIDTISSDPLLSFFAPLEDFIDELEEDFEHEAVQETDLRELEKKIIVDLNAPPTTTARPTTSTTTSKSVIPDHRTTNGVSWSKQNDGRGVMNDAVDPNTNLEPKSSVHIPENRAENHNSETKVMTEVPFDESPLNNLNTGEDNKPKINTSKAVWAVGAVLLATIIICTIAIFGRQRCRKTPKNRRYV